MKNYDVYGKVNRDSPGTEFGQKGITKAIDGSWVETVLVPNINT